MRALIRRLEGLPATLRRAGTSSKPPTAITMRRGLGGLRALAAMRPTAMECAAYRFRDVSVPLPAPSSAQAEPLPPDILASPDRDGDHHRR
ncbi:MAG: hypothetical protein WA869_21190 [Alloacidobacterium sp.]